MLQIKCGGVCRLTRQELTRRGEESVLLIPMCKRFRHHLTEAMEQQHVRMTY